MIDVKTAIRAAADHLKGLYPDAPDSTIRLEEVEFAEHANEWLITMSFQERTDNLFAGMATGGLERRYKIFAIDAETGKMRSMKIRRLADA